MNFSVKSVYSTTFSVLECSFQIMGHQSPMDVKGLNVADKYVMFLLPAGG